MNHDISLKKKIFSIVDTGNEQGLLSKFFDWFIITLIILNLFVIFIETYVSIYVQYKTILDTFEYFTILVFTIEYILRLWTCTCYPEYRHPITGRVAYARTLNMLIDLLAIFPFYLAILLPLDPRIVKFLRLFRLFRIFKLFRYYGSTDVIWNVFRKNKEYLFTVLTVLTIFLIFVSYATYIIESDVQPEKFHDIDNAIWWAVVTLTTVGYGDVLPVTDLGKFLTIICLLIGIGIIALPTGIIASGFLEEIKLKKESKNESNHLSIVDELIKLQKLRDEGNITEEEYELIKKKIIQ
mgnify:CR=1 FL=1